MKRLHVGLALLGLLAGTWFWTASRAPAVGVDLPRPAAGDTLTPHLQVVKTWTGGAPAPFFIQLWAEGAAGVEPRFLRNGEFPEEGRLEAALTFFEHEQTLARVRRPLVPDC